ncbi:ribbon-helix-helix protein, CopG family [Desulfofustis glycolicus]|uniref:Ribbon-helix-helix protein, copG family n=1 Tax=Desulfofustis glycolicus DSM 9705 TaxID=1121409 RepID=A0A1M5YM48_9BACT|nr:ribbon-helix-helix protein, CopG family [Desulfofustis glycolicus]SHI13066.1 Ribbon-helix-helix protein, copG family [Desulfofustis glycolicus DSM 9705]
MAPETKKVSFDCSVELLERLDKLAQKGDIPRSKMIANVVEIAVDTLEDCQKIGLLQVSLLMRNMGEYLKSWSKKMKEKKDLEGLM